MHTPRENVDLMGRYQLDRRRVEDAFFQFALLRVCLWYPEHFKVSCLALHSATSSTILNITSQYHGMFMKKYPVADDLKSLYRAMLVWRHTKVQPIKVGSQEILTQDGPNIG